MKKINTTELALLVAPFKSFQFCSLTRFEEMKLVKNVRDSKPKIKTEGMILCKLTKMINIGIGYEYAKSVQNARKAEGHQEQFEVKELPWGEWAEGSKTIINHYGAQYLRLNLFPNSKSTTTWTLNGKQISAEDAYRIVKDKPSKITGSARQETEKEIIVMSPKLAPIKHIAFDGETYEVGDQTDMIATELEMTANNNKAIPLVKIPVYAKAEALANA